MFEKEAEEYRESKRHKSFRADVGTVQINYESYLNNLQSAFKDGAEFGYNKANEWHDLRKDPNDLPKGKNIHRKVLLQDRYGDVYTGNYYPKDECHSENCFSVEYLEYGFQGCNFVAFEQIAKWAEFKE